MNHQIPVHGRVPAAGRGPSVTRQQPRTFFRPNDHEVRTKLDFDYASAGFVRAKTACGGESDDASGRSHHLTVAARSSLLAWHCGGVDGRAEVTAFRLVLPAERDRGQRSKGPVGDENDFRRAAVSVPLIAGSRAGTAPRKTARLHMQSRVGHSDHQGPDGQAGSVVSRDRKVAFAIARPKRAREQKQSSRAQTARGWIWAKARASCGAREPDRDRNVVMAGLRHPWRMKSRLRNCRAGARSSTICRPRADADLMLGARESV